MEHKFLIPGLIGLMAVLGVGYWIFAKQSGASLPEIASTASIPEGAHVVTLTKDGFSPSRLTITQGETVAFRSTTGELFWPASNLHPSHNIYPEFDPLGPVQQGAVWSFTFAQVGEWQYHDHLAPYYTGVITVTE